MLVTLDNRIAKKRRKLKRIRTEMKMDWQTDEMKTEQRIRELVSLRKQLMKEFGVILSKKLKQQRRHTRKRK